MWLIFFQRLIILAIIYDRTVIDIGGAPIAATVVNVFVSENFILGSMTTGSGWPTGATINLYIQPGAKILGPGGNGGSGGSAIAYRSKYTYSPFIGLPPITVYNISAKTTTSPTGGTAGGTALEILHPMNITNNGIIGGGGGGAGGAGAAAAALTFTPEYNGYGAALAAIGGNGGGGGAGFPAGSGGTAGTQDAYSYRIITDQFFIRTERRYDDPALFLGPITLPGAAKDGGILLGGRDKAIAFQNSYKSLDYPALGPIIETFVKSPNSTSGVGHGGDLGETGEPGGDGFGRWRIISLPNEFYDGETNAENGATAGAAGAAINTNGNTVTYLITGDIRGAII